MRQSIISGYARHYQTVCYHMTYINQWSMDHRLYAVIKCAVHHCLRNAIFCYWKSKYLMVSNWELVIHLKFSYARGNPFWISISHIFVNAISDVYNSTIPNVGFFFSQHYSYDRINQQNTTIALKVSDRIITPHIFNSGFAYKIKNCFAFYASVGTCATSSL